MAGQLETWQPPRTKEVADSVIMVDKRWRERVNRWHRANEVSAISSNLLSEERSRKRATKGLKQDSSSKPPSPSAPSARGSRTSQTARGSGVGDNNQAFNPAPRASGAGSGGRTSMISSQRMRASGQQRPSSSTGKRQDNTVKIDNEIHFDPFSDRQSVRSPQSKYSPYSMSGKSYRPLPQYYN